MSCNNCYNGCSETVSDKCVKYTGLDVPELGIENGDSLASVEQAIFDFLVPVLDGSGIRPIIDDQYICSIIQNYLPNCAQCDGFTLNEIVEAIIRTICRLSTSIDSITATLTTLNSNYNIGCLTGVSPSTDTHDMLQATIYKVCELVQDFADLQAYVTANTLTPTDVTDIIIAYLNTTGYFTEISSRMVPYAIVAFFPTPAVMVNFDPTGAGIGLWNKIYLCNGLNETPDLRGRVLAGATSGMAGNTLSPDVNPGGFNPTYNLGATAGSNSVTLLQSQMPIHTHSNTITSSLDPATHSHTYAKTDQPNSPGQGVNIGYNAVGDDQFIGATLQNTSEVTLTLTTSITNVPAGGGQAHANNQPAIGVYYIMYIP